MKYNFNLMQSNKDKSKKEGKPEKKPTDSGKKTIPKTSVKKETGKTMSKTGSTISTSTTRPQTGRTSIHKTSEKEFSKSTSKVETKPPITKTSKLPTKAPTKAVSESKIIKTPIEMKKRFPKFMKLIEDKKVFSGMTVIIKKRFNHWKTVTLLKKQQITEKTQKTILTKKKLNIRRIPVANQPEKKESSKVISTKPENMKHSTTKKVQKESFFQLFILSF